MAKFRKKIASGSSSTKRVKGFHALILQLQQTHKLSYKQAELRANKISQA